MKENVDKWVWTRLPVDLDAMKKSFFFFFCFQEMMHKNFELTTNEPPALKLYAVLPVAVAIIIPSAWTFVIWQSSIKHSRLQRYADLPLSITTSFSTWNEFVILFSEIVLHSSLRRTWTGGGECKTLGISSLKWSKLKGVRKPSEPIEKQSTTEIPNAKKKIHSFILFSGEILCSNRAVLLHGIKTSSVRQFLFLKKGVVNNKLIFPRCFRNKEDWVILLMASIW